MRKCFITAYICGLLGFYFGGQYNSDFSLTWYKEANAVKYDLLVEYEAMDSIIGETLLSTENADKGIYEDLIDEMYEAGYFSHQRRLDSLLCCEE